MINEMENIATDTSMSEGSRVFKLQQLAIETQSIQSEIK